MSISSGTTAVPSVPQHAQLGLVEGGVGDGEAALGRQARQLGGPERDLVGDGGLPVAQEIGGGDVVVVHEFGLGPRREDVVDGAPDGRLIEQPAVAAGSAELDDRLALGLHVLGVAAVEDVRVDADGTQTITQVEGVHADGVSRLARDGITWSTRTAVQCTGASAAPRLPLPHAPNGPRSRR